MNRPSHPMTQNTAFIRMVVSVLVVTLRTATLIFISAGRLDWPLDWLFMLAWGLVRLVFAILLRWRNPELIVERATRHAKHPTL